MGNKGCYNKLTYKNIRNANWGNGNLYGQGADTAPEVYNKFRAIVLP